MPASCRAGYNSFHRLNLFGKIIKKDSAVERDSTCVGMTVKSSKTKRWLYKFQIPNSKQNPKSQAPNSKQIRNPKL
jgi:hypothetical protein